MRRPRARFFALAALALLAVIAVVAGGCSGDDDGGDGFDLAAAVDDTLDAGTGQWELSATVTGLPGTSEPVTVTGDGSFSVGDRLVGGTADLSSLFQALRESLGLPSILDSAFDEPVAVAGDGQFLYLNVPLLAATAGGGSWVKIDVGAAAGGGAFAVAADPAVLLQLVRGATEVEAAGTEEVRGEAAMHYTGMFTLDGAVENAPDDEREQLEGVIESLDLGADARTQPIPFEVWIDGDSRVTRTAVDFAFEGSDVDADLRLDLFEFGSDVDIEVPDDAADVTDLLSSVGG